MNNSGVLFEQVNYVFSKWYVGSSTSRLTRHIQFLLLLHCLTETKQHIKLKSQK